MQKLFGKVSDMALVKKVVTCHPHTTVYECIRYLIEKNVGCVVVVKPDTQKVAGIFTERDYMMKIAEKNVDRKMLSVGKYMTTDVTLVKVDDSVSDVVVKMLVGHFRHIPVVNDDGNLVSLLSIRDILAHIVRRLIHSA